MCQHVGQRVQLPLWHAGAAARCVGRVRRAKGCERGLVLCHLLAQPLGLVGLRVGAFAKHAAHADALLLQQVQPRGQQRLLTLDAVAAGRAAGGLGECLQRELVQHAAGDFLAQRRLGRRADPDPVIGEADRGPGHLRAHDIAFQRHAQRAALLLFHPEHAIGLGSGRRAAEIVAQVR
ncbi:hypothetical protein D9M72_528410 [compost metagenome]